MLHEDGDIFQVTLLIKSLYNCVYHLFNKNFYSFQFEISVSIESKNPHFLELRNSFSHSCLPKVNVLVFRTWETIKTTTCEDHVYIYIGSFRNSSILN